MPQGQGGWTGALLGAAVGLCLATALVRWDITQRRESFQSDARTLHRLLSQRAAGLEAVLGLLRLADPALRATAAAQVRALYPELVALHDERLPPAPAQAGVHISAVDVAARRFHLRTAAVAAAAADRAAAPALAEGVAESVHAANAANAANAGARDHGLALHAVVDVDRWFSAAGAAALLPPSGPVAAHLRWQGESVVLAAGGPARGTTPGFVFEKPLGAPAQPWHLHLQRRTGPADWPWPGLLAVCASSMALGAGLAALRQQRRARREAEALLRLDRLSRLDTLGRMAAGLAHELNQPLTAVLASTQAARRLLPEQRPGASDADNGAEAASTSGADEALLREALDHAVAQTRRAANIVARLRQGLDGGRTQPSQPAPQVLDLRQAMQHTLALLAPELRAAGVAVTEQGGAGSRLAPAAAPRDALGVGSGDGNVASVWADPVALDQILHNLIRNAVQAMRTQPAARRRIHWHVAPPQHGQRCLHLRDHGPGLPDAVARRLFQPFNRADAEAQVAAAGGRPGQPLGPASGLGLGLCLSETLAAEMGGALRHRRLPAGEPGAAFCLCLPLAPVPHRPPGSAAAPLLPPSTPSA